MDMRRSFGWVALGVAALASVIALGFGHGPWRARSLAEQGSALVAEGRYLSAVRVLSEAVAEAPGNARVHYDLGLAYAGIGLCGAAWIHLGEAMRLAPVYRHLPEGPGSACQVSAMRIDGAGQFDHAVHRDR